jgi:hypothetical protein
MAYIGRGNTGNRDGHGWAIAGAFAGQAAIIVSIGALLAGSGTTTAGTQVSMAVPAPAVAKPGPALSVVPDMKAPADFSYQVTMDGQSGGGVFPDTSPVPSFMVKPGQDLAITLDVTVPPAKSVTTMRVSLIGAASDSQAPSNDTQVPSNDTVQPQPLFSGTYVFPSSPGTHVFVLSWPGSASELTPGTMWTLFMSAGTADSGYGGSIATVTVAP